MLSRKLLKQIWFYSFFVLYGAGGALLCWLLHQVIPVWAPVIMAAGVGISGVAFWQVARECFLNQ